MATPKLLFPIALLVAGAAATVSAATFAVRPDRDLVHTSDAVVIATPIASYATPAETGGIETVTPMAVEEVIKGDVTGTVIDVVEPGGVYGGNAMIIAGAPRFAEGRRVLLFLMKTGQERWSVLDLVVGKFTFAEDRLGQRLLVRDEDEIVGVDGDLQPHRETRRSAERFLDFVRAEAHGQTGANNYSVPKAELTEPTAAPHGRLGAAAFQVIPLIAPYTATSYTMTISGSLGSRWNVFPNGVNVYMGSTQEPGAPGGGATAVQTAINSWDGDCASNVNYVYAGVDDGTHTQGLHGADGRNTVLFERDLSTWGIPAFSCSGSGYSGTRGIGGITSAGGNNTVSGETFVTTQEGDVEMNRGIANCSLLLNSGDWNSAVTHEVGPTLGLRHARSERRAADVGSARGAGRVSGRLVRLHGAHGQHLRIVDVDHARPERHSLVDDDGRRDRLSVVHRHERQHRTADRRRHRPVHQRRADHDHELLAARHEQLRLREQQHHHDHRNVHNACSRQERFQRRRQSRSDLAQRKQRRHLDVADEWKRRHVHAVDRKLFERVDRRRGRGFQQ